MPQISVVDIVHGTIVNVWQPGPNADQGKVRKDMNLAMENKVAVVAAVAAEVEAVAKKVVIPAKVALKDVTDHDAIMTVIIVDRVALDHNNNNSSRAKMAAMVAHVMTKVNRVAMALEKVAHHHAAVDVGDVAHHPVVSIVATSAEEEVAVVQQDDHEAKMARTAKQCKIQQVKALLNGNNTKKYKQPLLSRFNTPF